MTRVLFDNGNFAFADKYIEFLPPSRREKALRYYFDIDRRMCIGCYLLLYKMCLDIGIDISHREMEFGRYGKPYLPDFPMVKFSFTHCRKCIACSISNHDIGVDAEETIKIKRKTAKLLFTQREINMIDHSESPSDEMTKLWTVKESIAKCSGEGLSGGLSQVKPINNRVVSRKISKDVWLSICGVGPEKSIIVTNDLFAL